MRCTHERGHEVSHSTRHTVAQRIKTRKGDDLLQLLVHSGNSLQVDEQVPKSNGRRLAGNRQVTILLLR